MNVVFLLLSYPGKLNLLSNRTYFVLKWLTIKIIPGILLVSAHKNVKSHRCIVKEKFMFNGARALHYKVDILSEGVVSMHLPFQFSCPVSSNFTCLVVWMFHRYLKKQHFQKNVNAPSESMNVIVLIWYDLCTPCHKKIRRIVLTLTTFAQFNFLINTQMYHDLCIM